MIFDDKNDGRSFSPSKPKKNRTASDMIDASLLVIVAGLLVAIVCIMLVQFAFDAHIDWRKVGIDTAVVTACTIAIYLLLRSYTLRKGRKTEAWISAKKALDDVGEDIVSRGFAKDIYQYCRAWESARLKEDQAATLNAVGIDVDKFNADYRRISARELREQFPDLSKVERRAIRKARHCRRLRYDERYLQVNVEQSFFRVSPSGGLRAKTVAQIDTARTVLTTVITSFAGVSFLADVIFDFSARSVIACVVKLVVVAFFSALGMIGGFNHATVREVNEMTARASEARVFIKWCESGNNSVESPGD